MRIIITGENPQALKNQLQMLLTAMGGEENTEVSGSQPYYDMKPDYAPVAEVQPDPAADHLPPVAVEEPAPMEQPVTVATGELDSRGLPWDVRINNKGRTKTKTGDWKYIKGIDREVLVPQVEAELRANAPSTPVAPIPAAPLVAAQASAVQAVDTLAQTVIAPAVAAVQPVVSAPAASIGHTVESFTANLIPTIASLINEGKVTQETIDQWKQHFNVNDIWDVNSEQAAVMFEQFCISGIIAKV